MKLDGALQIADSGLANIGRQMAILSQNVANAGTPGYVTQVATQRSVTDGVNGLGVATGPTQRQVDVALQGATFQQATTVAGLTTQQTALQAIDAVLGTPGQGSDLPSLLGDLQNQFSSLLSSPDSQVQQARVVASATTLSRGINGISDAYATQRQAAQDDLTNAVGRLNGDLSTIGSLSNKIIALQAGGQSTANLESQRDAAVSDLSQLVDIRTFNQSNGDLTVVTPSGLSLPTRGDANPLVGSDVKLQAGAFYPGGGIPAITLGGADVTRQLRGGQIGADIALRDVTIPAYQAQLDEFSQTLASRFGAQGLTLFTDPTGAVPGGGGSPAQAGYVGFAGTIQVNPAIQANTALVRDGTTAIVGSPTGASAFTPNLSGGPAGFTTLIQRVMSYAMGTDAQAGVAQPAPNGAGLGPSGTLSAPYSTTGSLSDFATAMVASQAQASATVSSQLATEQAVQTSLNARLSSTSGVNMDTEMSAMIGLQSAYSANARVMATVQAMFSQLLDAVH